MSNLLCFVVTVLAFIVLFYGLIIRSQLIASLVAFNNVHRRILKLPPKQCQHYMYAVNHMDSFEILVRKRVVGFIDRFKVSNNSIISWIDNSWKMKFDIWNPWIKLLYN